MLTFKTTNSAALLAAFKKAIDDKKVVTWSYDAAGDFTHTPDQWKNQAWMRPVLYQGQLTMNFLGNPRTKNMREVYGVYHGRFSESMLIHCDTLFDNVTASALASNTDSVATAA